MTNLQDSVSIQRVTFLGGGIIGLIAAGSLATRGVHVRVLTRPAHAEAIRSRGLEIREPDGRSWRADSLIASSELAELAGQPSDLVVLSAKTFDTEELLDGWRAAGGDLRRALSLQNTVRNEELLSTAFDEVAGAVVRIGGDVAEPGVISARPGRRVELGVWPSGESAWLSEFAQVLIGAGIGATMSPDIVAAKFGKLVLNVESALTAVADLGVNQVGGHESVEIRRLMRDEAVAVADAEGLRLGALPAIEAAPVPPTPSGRSSTWHDLNQRRGRTETGWLNGHVVELGLRHGIPTPANAVLNDLVTEAVAAGDGPGTSTPGEILARIRLTSMDS